MTRPHFHEHEPPGEFPPEGAADPPALPPDGISRRRFLALLSASAALAAGGASCSRIDRGSIVPYTKRPAEVVPGVAAYYASTFVEGLEAQGVLVKTREGRPIHVEGNGEHPLSEGKASLRAVADILSLYDPDRLRGPVLSGKPASWSEAMGAVVKVLREARDGNRPVLLLTGAVVSPTLRALIGDLKRVLPAFRHASWEPALPDAEIAAARSVFGEHLVPRIRFDRAEVILSFQEDFVGSGSSPLSIRDFASRRRPEKPGVPMSRLWVLEGPMTLTGANADHRIAIRPSKAAPLAFALARTLHESHGLPLPRGIQAGDLSSFDLAKIAGEVSAPAGLLKALADDLRRAGRSALVLAGPGLPPEAHGACLLLNSMLGAEGQTTDASLAPAPADLLTLGEVQGLLREAAGGSFAAAIFWGVNPAYAFPDLGAWKAAAEKIPFRARIGLHEDETAKDCQAILPESHWLESWGDAEPSLDLLSLRQPAIGTLHGTRQGEDVLLEILRALGSEAPPDYRSYLMERWRKEVYSKESPVPFERFWNAVLHDGVLRRGASPREPRSPRGEAFAEWARKTSSAPAPSALELTILPGAAVGDGRYGNNGWLQELPHPVTKLTWGNALSISSGDAGSLGLRDGDVVKLEAGGASAEVPVLVQPGQAAGVASL